MQMQWILREKLRRIRPALAAYTKPQLFVELYMIYTSDIKKNGLAANVDYFKVPLPIYMTIVE